MDVNVDWNDLNVHEEVFADDGTFPNSALPVLIYKGVLDDPSAEGLEALFDANGWPPQWRSGIFTYHHYHSTAHEALGIASGTARVMLGGPQGREFVLKAGDVVVLPAGIAHMKVSSSVDFLVVGAYPDGAEDWDILRGEAGERPLADARIAGIGRPETDPVAGADGPLARIWGRAGAGPQGK